MYMDRDYKAILNLRTAEVRIINGDMSIFNSDENIFNIVVKVMTYKDTKKSVQLNSNELENYTFKIDVVKPSKEWVYAEGVIKDDHVEFDLPKHFYDQVGDYIAQFEVTCNEVEQETVTSKPFAYEVSSDILLGLNEEIENDKQYFVLKEITNDIDEIEELLKLVPKREELSAYVTKEEILDYATKEELNNYATREQMESYATREELNNYSTRQELNNYATKEELTTNYSTKDITATKEELKKYALLEELDDYATRYELDEYAKDEDLNYYAPINNPRFTTAISLGRETNSVGGQNSIATGYSVIASGDYSHAEGYDTTAKANSSHAEGRSTIASSQYQHVEGRYNVEDSANKYAHIVGNGSTSLRSNAHTLDWNGNAWYKGNVSVDGTPTNDNDLVTKKYVDSLGVGGGSTSGSGDCPIQTFEVYKEGTVLGNVSANINIDTFQGGLTYAFTEEQVNKYSGVTLHFIADDGTVKTVGYTNVNAMRNMDVYRSDTEIVIGLNNMEYVVDITDRSTANNVIVTTVRNVKYLPIDNTREFTPTEDYNPATKKYVDEVVANVGGGSSSGSQWTKIDSSLYTIDKETYIQYGTIRVTLEQSLVNELRDQIDNKGAILHFTVENYGSQKDVQILLGKRYVYEGDEGKYRIYNNELFMTFRNNNALVLEVYMDLSENEGFFNIKLTTFSGVTDTSEIKYTNLVAMFIESKPELL